MVAHGINDALLRGAGTPAPSIGHRHGGGAVRRLLVMIQLMGRTRSPRGVTRALGATDAELIRFAASARPTAEDVRVHALLRQYGGRPPRI